MEIYPKGSPSSSCWVLIEDPYPQDKNKGYLFSGSFGFVWDRMMAEAGIKDYYVLARRPDPEHKTTYKVIENELNHYKPPLIITLEHAGKALCSELQRKVTKKTAAETTSDIQKYCGSLLQCSRLNYPHYIVPTFAPDTICKDWSLRDIVVNLDLGKVREELKYVSTHGHLQALPTRTLDYSFDGMDGFAKLLYILEERFSKAKLLSNDIETVYPKNKKSKYFGINPGYPVCIGLADSADYGISFDLFRQSKVETVKLWQVLSELFWEVPQLGQNFFNFDSNYYEALGFRIDLNRCQDTMIRHAQLWPELPHKLQFLTRQYTRQPYYKDEGHGWNIKNLSGLKHYNCLDVTVTYEVFEGQEEEYNERPWLRS